jgi:membrane fusion protein, hemolysin D
VSLRRHLEVLRESVRSEAGQRAKTLRETDFLPAALEVLETPPNPIGRGILWALLAFVAIAVAWAGFGHVDVVASAQGKIIPRGRVRIIQAADAGVVRAIHIVDGTTVAAGDALIELDPTISAADATQARESLAVAAIDRARARALVRAAAGEQAVFEAPEGMRAEEVATQQSLITSRVAEHRNAIAALQQDRRQRNADLAMVGAEVRKLEEQLPLAEMQLSSLETLEGPGVVPRLRVAEVKERVVGMRQDLIIRQEEQEKHRAALAGVSSQIAKLESEFRARALDALNEAEANYRLRAEEVTKAQDRASLTVLTSPIDGTVAQLAVHTLGAVVKPADALLTIVPKEEELIVEAMVLNKDIGFVEEGQQVRVKLEAFPFTRYGVIAGEVERISRDAVDNQDLGLVFPALVKLSRSYVEIGDERIPVAPGFAATAEIRTGDRRIIEFLLSPLSRRLQEAGRER